MNRTVWMRTARSARLLTAIPRGRRLPALARRPFSVLLQDNPYLPQLLASDGLGQFYDPAKVAHSDPPLHPAKYTFSFAIDRQAVQPSCQITAETQSEFQRLAAFHYPPFSPSAKATEISINPRVKAVADVLWKSFCVNDFLNLDVTGLLHPDGSWSFEQCEAVVDECAVHRQGELFKHVTRYEYPEEIEAEKSLLVYRRMDPPGPIGTVVNGAGLAMSTCDTIELLNGRSANFLDAGGKATPATIKEAFRLVLKNPEVNVILVNIFGGVIQGDMIATGIISAMKDLEIGLPVVARIQGTNGALGMKMLREAGMKNIVAEENLFNAVKAAVELSKRDGPDSPSTNNPTTSTPSGPVRSSNPGSSPSTSASTASSPSSARSAQASLKSGPPTKARGFFKLKHIEPASVNRYGLYRPELGIYRGLNRQKPYLSVPHPPQPEAEVKTRISEIHARKLLRKWLAGEWAPSLHRRDIQPMLKGLDEGILGPNARFWNE